jgi:hypothetical protein
MRFLIVLLLSATATSCVKPIIEGTKNNPAADYTLRLNVEENDGAFRQYVNIATNKPEAAETNAIVQVKVNKVNMRLGGIQMVGTVPMTIGVNLEFLQTSQTSQIAGEYQLPADAGKLSVKLSWMRNNQLIQLSPATRGNVKVQYDAATQTWNGVLSGISFEKPLNADYKSLELLGTFKHVPFQ